MTKEERDELEIILLALKDFEEKVMYYTPNFENETDYQIARKAIEKVQKKLEE